VSKITLTHWMNRFEFSASVHARPLSDKPGDVK